MTKINLDFSFDLNSNDVDFFTRLSKKVLKVLSKDFLVLNKKNIDVLICDDSLIRQMNAEFRQVDKATNVLSFENTSRFDDKSLGSIALSFDTLHTEAVKKNISLENHFLHLFLHGVLHLLGFDHIEDDDAEKMELLEVVYLKKMGVENPYE